MNKDVCAQMMCTKFIVSVVVFSMFAACHVAAMIRANLAMRDTFRVVEETLDAHPCTDAPTMERLLRSLLPEYYGKNGEFPLSFPEANALDDYFFHVGKTSLWRRAYGFPTGGKLSTQPSVAAVDVGMFTFNLER